MKIMRFTDDGLYGGKRLHTYRWDVATSTLSFIVDTTIFLIHKFFRSRLFVRALIIIIISVLYHFIHESLQIIVLE